MNITGGKNGKTAKVTSRNRLGVDSVIVSREHYINHDLGKAFSLSFNQSPDAAGDCIFFMQNTDTDDLVIEAITIGVINCTADDSIYIKLGDTGTRDAATDLTPVPVNGGSGEEASGVFEKGIHLNDGTLAGGSEIQRYVMAGVTDLVSKDFNMPQGIIIPKNRTLSMYVDGSDTGTWYITIHFNYHASEE
jgi:hypothetical protein